MRQYLFLIAFLTLTLPISGATGDLEKLGTRHPTCNSDTPDFSEISFPGSDSSELQKLLKDDKLKEAVLPGIPCLRVGASVDIRQREAAISYLGKGLVKKVEVMTEDQLLSRAVAYLPTNPALISDDKKVMHYTVVSFDMFERARPTVVTDADKSLPTCLPSNGFFTRLRLEEGDEDLLKNIETGKISALAFNGVYNCYRIGRKTVITMPKKKDIGSIYPEELELVHLTQLTDAHAAELNMSLEEFKDSLQPKADLAGGYVTIMKFEYTKE